VKQKNQLSKTLKHWPSNHHKENSTNTVDFSMGEETGHSEKEKYADIFDFGLENVYPEAIQCLLNRVEKLSQVLRILKGWGRPSI
jgi:hypothetical protein